MSEIWPDKILSKINSAMPDPAAVARRALILAALSCRGFIDHGVNSPDAESLRERIRQWMQKLDLYPHMQPGEIEMIDAPLATLEQHIPVHFAWKVEGLTVLAWALEIMEFPRQDKQVDPYSMTDAVFFLEEDAGELIRQARLRAAEERSVAHRLIEAVDARLKDFVLNRKRKDFAGQIDPRWLETLKIDPKRFFADSDFAIGGKPLADVPDEYVRTCEEIVTEQLGTVAWLNGRES